MEGSILQDKSRQIRQKEYSQSEQQDLFERIGNHKPGIIGEQEIFRSAVVIPLLQSADGWDVLFEVRSGKIPDQPGDICLPGGRMEDGEAPEETALRELCEELLISEKQVRMLGATDFFHNGNLIIYPYAAVLSAYGNTFHEAEVATVFRVPLAFFAETIPERYEVASVVTPGDDFPYERIRGGRNYKWRGRSSTELFYQYENHTIWGITARIMRAFAERFLV